MTYLDRLLLPFGCFACLPAAYVKILQEVDRAWLREQKVDFFLCDQHWVQDLAEAKGGDELRYQGVIKVALEKRIQLRTMDWAVQCFIEGKALDPESCPRYLVNWPKAHPGSKKTSPNRYPEELFWFKLAKERYEVGQARASQ